MAYDVYSDIIGNRKMVYEICLIMNYLVCSVVVEFQKELLGDSATFVYFCVLYELMLLIISWFASPFSSSTIIIEYIQRSKYTSHKIVIWGMKTFGKASKSWIPAFIFISSFSLHPFVFCSEYEIDTSGLWYRHLN